MTATKKCVKCYAEKGREFYYDHYSNTDGKQGTCIPCNKAKRRARWFEVFKYKGSKCEHCGISDLHHPEIYEYHHVDPALKRGVIGAMLGTASDTTLYIEVDKCILVCANCHSIEHKRISDKELEQDD